MVTIWAEWASIHPKSFKCSSVTVAETLEASQVLLGCDPDTVDKKVKNVEPPNQRASVDLVISVILEVSEQVKVPISKTSISIDHFYSIYISLSINLLMPLT